ncbi:MAG: hypothetical protein RQ760_20465 [Sedimentisphaerales bacterium]|nr:hypothetical protein [Sedimentisphaerales bacterium]
MNYKEQLLVLTDPVIEHLSKEDMGEIQNVLRVDINRHQLAWALSRRELQQCI